MMLRVMRVFIPLFILLLIIGCSTTHKQAPLVRDPEVLLREANEKLQNKDYDSARDKLEMARAVDVSKKYAPIIQLRLADTYFQEERYDEAIQEYNKFLDLHPYHKYAPYARYQIAMSYFDQVEDAERNYAEAGKALAEFEKIKRLYPRNPYREMIDHKIQTCRDILAAHEFYVGEFYFKNDSYKAAAERFSWLIKEYPNSPKVPDAMYQLALAYKKLGDMEKAALTAKTLIQKYPDSKFSREAEKAFTPKK